MKKLFTIVCTFTFLLSFVVPIMAQDTREFPGHMILRPLNPVIYGDGNVQIKNKSGTLITHFTLNTAPINVSSGTATHLSLAPTINQSGTAGYTAIKLNVTETATGSGTKNLFDLQVGGSSKFSVSNAGVVSIAGASQSIASDTGCYQTGSTADTFLCRTAAATWQYGAADAAAPIAQTIAVQSVVAGTTNTAGTNFTIKGSAGTGTGVGGNIIARVAYPSTTGSTQNSFSTFLTANGTNNGSSGVTTLVDISPTINGSGTNGYNGLRVNVTETATGSGVKYALATALAGTTKFSVDSSGNVLADANGTIAGFKKVVVSASTGTTALTAAQSGAMVLNTGTGGTTTFTLPVAAAGLNFCFSENGDAAGELLINPGDASTSIIGKTHGAQDASGIATAAGTGIKNTAATNVRGDHTCLVAYNATTWVMTSVAGVWASQ